MLKIEVINLLISIFFYIFAIKYLIYGGKRDKVKHDHRRNQHID